MTERWLLSLDETTHSVTVGETEAHLNLVEWSEPYLHSIAYGMMGAGDQGLIVRPIGSQDVVSALVLLHRGFQTGDTLEQCVMWSETFMKENDLTFEQSDKTIQVTKYLWPTH